MYRWINTVPEVLTTATSWKGYNSAYDQSRVESTIKIDEESNNFVSTHLSGRGCK